VTGAIVVACVVSLIGRPKRSVALSWTVLGPPFALLAIATLSAVANPYLTGEALKFVVRQASGVLALVVTVCVVTSPSRLRTLMWAVSLGAGVSACIGLAEAAGWRTIDPLLAAFKQAPTLVGGDLRVSATFQYATIAAMFYELATPLALALAATARNKAARILATSVAVVCSAAVVLTLTRAGIGTLAVIFAVVLGLALARRPYRRLAPPTAIAAFALVALTLGLAAREPNFNTRLTTENDLGWFGATYVAPAELDFGDQSSADVTFTVRNTGQATWTIDGDHPFALGYRWLSADGSYELEVPHTEVVLPRTVAPGEAIDVLLHISPALPRGDYRIAWGMVQHGITWFHHRGSPDSETSVHLTIDRPSSASASMPTLVQRDDSAAWTVVSRRELWEAAVRMFAERPLLGVGPDNFRHLYGAYLGRSVWDERIHSNNLYLELLADLGVMGFLAFGAVLSVAISALMRSLHAPTPGAAALRVLVVGLAASLLAFLLHGFLDYFLEFTSIYVLFWMLIGLLVAAPSLRPEPGVTV
jgi:hypothetical protein